MKRNWIAIATALCAVTIAGCGNHDGDSIDQQRKDVMGAPAPPEEQAKIAAMQAAQAQKMRDAQAAAAQKPGKP